MKQKMLTPIDNFEKNLKFVEKGLMSYYDAALMFFKETSQSNPEERAQRAHRFILGLSGEELLEKGTR